MSWDLLLHHEPSPLEELHDSHAASMGVRVFVKRDDLLALYALKEAFPAFCGNKWRKLKYNLLEAKKSGYAGLLTFGGAYSNHIAAVAAAGRIFGFRTVGIIRGEPHVHLNPTLSFATACGMELRYLDRISFKNLRETGWQDPGHALPADYLQIPEGGTNDLALKGCMELGAELSEQTDAGFICIPCGTGGTIAGLYAGLGHSPLAIGFSALKGGAFLYGDIQSLLEKHPLKGPLRLQMETGYHFGGYAKRNPQLLQFIPDFQARHGFLLDYVYTAKMFFGVFDLIRTGYFPYGSTICLIHTGGLQGGVCQ